MDYNPNEKPDEEVECEIQETPRALKKEVHMLRVENQELLAELGRVLVENTAKEREARNTELFQQIYRPSPPEAKESVVYTCDDKATTKDDKLGCVLPESGNVGGTSNAASTSSEGNIDQTLTEQSCESLSFSAQQEYPNEKEKLSLRNVPPTSVATTMYNTNYKLLLLSLGQMLHSSDDAKLMSWATQNFPVVNPQNATHVLFQLDESGVINATDLSQLRHFFESIVRFDLVYIIDEFLLGNYAILRQIPASKKRDARTTQNPQHGTATRNSNLLNAASTSQFPLRGSSARVENINEPPSFILQQKQQAFPSSFAHKLERRPLPNSRIGKRSGK